MNTKSYEAAVIKVLCENSQSPVFDEAKKEWDMVHVSYQTHHCELCGKNPIHWVFQLNNKRTNKGLFVGSECVVNYLTIDGRSHDEMVNYVKSVLKTAVDEQTRREWKESYPWALEFVDNPDHSLVVNGKIKSFVEYYKAHGRLSDTQRAKMLAIILDHKDHKVLMENIKYLHETMVVSRGEAEKAVLRSYMKHKGWEPHVALNGEIYRKFSLEGQAALKKVTECGAFSAERKRRFRDLLVRKEWGNPLLAREEDFYRRTLKEAETHGRKF